MVSVMRRLGIRRLDPLDLGSLQRARLQLHLLPHPLDGFCLLDHHAVQFLDLMFEMRDVRFEAGKAL